MLGVHKLLQRHTRQPLTLRVLLVYAVSGLCLGMVGSYVLMGTLHAVRKPFVAATARYKAGSDTSSGATLARDDRQQAPSSWLSAGSDVHVLFTSNGSPYSNYQTRIMVGTFRLAQQMPGGQSLAAITRILHRTTPDVLMHEVDTFHALPLTPKCDDWCEFPVADRPNAVRQFFDTARTNPALLKAPWVLLIESDFVWMRPLSPLPGAETSRPGWAYKYDYITPEHPAAVPLLRQFFPESQGPMSAIPATGPSPVVLRASEWLRVLPDWERLTAEFERSEGVRKVLGWVREMYAFSIACALQRISMDVMAAPNSPLISQPPSDSVLGSAAMLHYTWGDIIKDERNNVVWQFDKRFHTDPSEVVKVPLLEEPIAFRPGLKVIGATAEGTPVTLPLVELLRQMIQQMNAAIRTLPDLSRSR